MKKFSNKYLVFALALLLMPFLLSSSNAAYREKNKTIIGERVSEELKENQWRRRVAQEELESAKKSYIKLIEKISQLKLMKRSNRFLQKECMVIDYECHRIYNMTDVYLQDEISRYTAFLEKEENRLRESKKRFHYFDKRVFQLKNGIGIAEIDLAEDVSIPALKDFYRCKKVPGWNVVRGVFISPLDIVELPVCGKVTAVHKESGTNFISISYKKFMLHLSYVGQSDIQSGDIIKKGSKVFPGKSFGNPVSPGNVLLFLTKNNKLIDPTFVCK